MSTINFYISNFDSEVDVSKALISAEAVSPIGVDRVLTQLYVDASAIRQCFKFSTNAQEVNDDVNNDLHFYTNADLFKDVSASTKYVFDTDACGVRLASLSAMLAQSYVMRADHANIPPNRIYNVEPNGSHYKVDSKTLVQDVIRNLAFELFNTHYGTDIINNETDLHINFANRCTELLNSGGTIHTALSNDNQKNTDNSTIVYKMMKHLLSSNEGKDRFNDLSGNIYTSAVYELGDDNASGENLSTRKYTLPLKGGDTITFLLTAKYATDQASVINESGLYADRVYEIKLNLTESLQV